MSALPFDSQQNKIPLRPSYAPPEKLAWRDFDSRLDWRQSEHVTLIGPTGVGKTTLALELLERRKYPVVFGTKPSGTDQTLVELTQNHGYHLVERMPLPTPQLEKYQKIVFWPKFKSMTDQREQKRQLALCMAHIFERGGYCLYVDELPYLVEDLKMDSLCKLYWRMGRSYNISFVVSAQRPRWIPLMAYSQNSHIFCWRTRDREDLQRIGGIGFVDSHNFRNHVRNLPKHDFMYANADTDFVCQSKLELENE